MSTLDLEQLRTLAAIVKHESFAAAAVQLGRTQSAVTQQMQRLEAHIGHPLFEQPGSRLTWARLRDHAFAGLGYHSPNMALSHRAQLLGQATASDQEAIATLVLSGRYLGFLPDHYATGFEQQGRLRAVQAGRFHYACRFVSVMRRSPQPSRAARLFAECLRAAHAGPAQGLAQGQTPAPASASAAFRNRQM